MFKKLGIVSLMLLAVFVLGACNKSFSTSASTQTPVQSTATGLPTLEPTSTSIPVTPTIKFTATTAPTKTPEATSTPEATATPELIANLNTKLDASVNLEKLPVHQLDELTSGRLTYTEMQLGIKFPENTAKANLTISNLKDRFAIADFNPAANNYSDYYSPEKVPFKGITANMFEIDGQKVLVVGFLWMNSDNTTSVLHVGVQNWKDQTWMGYIKGAYQSTRRLGIISKIYNPSFNFSDWINFGNNQVIDQLYATDGGTRDQLIQKWVNTGNIPEELENLLLMPATARWK